MARKLPKPKKGDQPKRIKAASLREGQKAKKRAKRFEDIIKAGRRSKQKG
jgi:hypothetical protein